MSIWKPLRVLFIRTTDFTHGYQGEEKAALLQFYRVWASWYDLSIRLDPAYCRQLSNMIHATVRPGDSTLDIGCGTGLGTLYAASKSKTVLGIDPSGPMTAKLLQKIETQQIQNIQIRHGYFPGILTPTEKFDSIISSFMLAHCTPVSRKRLIHEMYTRLHSGGRLGLFTARGEIAATFPTKEELITHVSSAGFQEIEIKDVSDIYRMCLVTRN